MNNRKITQSYEAGHYNNLNIDTNKAAYKRAALLVSNFAGQFTFLDPGSWPGMTEN